MAHRPGALGGDPGGVGPERQRRSVDALMETCGRSHVGKRARWSGSLLRLDEKRTSYREHPCR
jgi:hypothetical protein